MSGSCVRVRLRFEQPPPLVCGAGPGAWLLVDMDACRLVADLEFLIKRRFGMSKRRRLNLWMDGFLLPPTEKIAVVRDGDVISVEQTEDVQQPTTEDPTSSNQQSTSERRRKRKAQTSEEDEDEPDTAGVQKILKRKKQKLNGSDSGVSTSSRVSVAAKEGVTKTKELQKAQAKKKEQNENTNPGKQSKIAAVLSKANNGTANKRDISKDATSKNSTSNGGKVDRAKTVKPIATKSTGKTQGSSSSSSSDDTSSSSDDSDSDTSSSESSSSDSDDEASVNKKTGSRKVTVNSTKQRGSSARQNEGFSSSSSAKVSSVGGNRPKGRSSTHTASPVVQVGVTTQVCREPPAPITQRLQEMTAGKQRATSSSYQKGKTVGPSSKSHIVFGSDSESGSDSTDKEDLQTADCADGSVVSSCLDASQKSTSQSSTSSGAVNERRKPSKLETVPPPAPAPVSRNYDALPPLHGPPRVGDRIAYKILEMSANYCPEISSYKEAEVTGYDPTCGDLELRVVYDSTAYMKQCQPGRFEMDVDLEDQEDQQDNKVTVAVSSLVEPRLVPDKSN